MSSRLSPADVRRGLDHPVVDADGHLLEIRPHVTEHVREIGGAAHADRFGDPSNDRKFHVGGKSFAWWGTPRDARDRATAYVPSLMYERLPELGFDYAVVYPTNGLGAARIADPEHRGVVVRAYNTYYREWIRGFEDRMTIPAIIPMQTPDEAIAVLEHAVCELGLTTGMFSAHVVRQGPDGPWFDVFGIDSAYDYDPLWRRCAELGVAPTFHTGGQGIGLRATGNYMFNHIGSFADVHQATAKALLMGGVTRRFPELAFAFLEGGVAWGVTLLGDLLARWEKRGGDNIRSLAPDQLDLEAFHGLMKRYGGERFDRDDVREATHGLFDGAPAQLDDFAAAGIASPEELVELFVPRFWFGCEADDPTNALAFDTARTPHGARLNAMLGSDIGHWDVPVMDDVLGEAWELVQHGAMRAEDFRDFACDNAIRLLTRGNPDFFAGTAVEAYAATVHRS
jgi:predicted TIM-barrel fold metal-dependent hydrolase